MTKTHIPLRFKQIAKDNFPNIPEDALILPLIDVSGSKEVVSLDVIKVGLNWLETYEEAMELKERVTPGKGLKRSNKPKNIRQHHGNQLREINNGT